MKKTKKPAVDEIRSEYKRSDFGELVRGKYAERLRKKSNVVVLDPGIADPLGLTGSLKAETARRKPRAILQSEKLEPISKPSIKL